jgi:hypothetical protein
LVLVQTGSGHGIRRRPRNTSDEARFEAGASEIARRPAESLSEPQTKGTRLPEGVLAST